METIKVIIVNRCKAKTHMEKKNASADPDTRNIVSYNYT